MRRARACSGRARRVAKWARWVAQHDGGLHIGLVDPTVRGEIRLALFNLQITPATRSHLSMRQGMSANAVRGDLCRAQAMQFSAQRGEWCAIGPGIHARGTAGMPVGCSARGQAQWKAAGAETRAAPWRVLRGVLRAC